MDILDLIKNEGDSHEWIHTSNGVDFKCFIKRHPNLKHLCGYVELTGDNKFYGKDYNDIPVQVHGGLTYANQEGDNWVIGFDCAHSGDLCPYLEDKYNSFGSGDVYRTKEYVISECESLTDQISEWSISKIRQVKLDKLF